MNNYDSVEQNVVQRPVVPATQKVELIGLHVSNVCLLK